MHAREIYKWIYVLKYLIIIIETQFVYAFIIQPQVVDYYLCSMRANVLKLQIIEIWWEREDRKVPSTEQMWKLTIRPWNDEYYHVPPWGKNINRRHHILPASSFSCPFDLLHVFWSAQKQNFQNSYLKFLF